MLAVRRAVALVAATVFAGTIAGAGVADSTPIGPLPPGPSSTIVAGKGALVSIAVPDRGAGRVWRIARRFDSRIVRQVGEGNVAGYVVLVFRTYRPGTTRISLALTRGETTKALEARRVTVRVR